MVDNASEQCRDLRQADQYNGPILKCLKDFIDYVIVEIRTDDCIEEALAGSNGCSDGDRKGDTSWEIVKSFCGILACLVGKDFRDITAESSKNLGLKLSAPRPGPKSFASLDNKLDWRLYAKEKTKKAYLIKKQAQKDG